MSTRILVIKDSAPVAGRRLRIEGFESEFVTDTDGMIELDRRLTDETRIEVEDADSWSSQVAKPRESSSLVVVEIGRRETDPLFGDQIHLGDRYEFMEVLGRGGMGVVVKARDTVLARDVAIKMLSAAYRYSEEARAIFLDEGRSLAALSHHNLVGVHDVSVVEHNVLMVLEYVEGKNIETLLAERGSFDQLELLRLMIQLVRAIEYLHSEGVIHRDIKPGNLMLQPDGTLVVIDFGLARSLEQLDVRGTKVRGSPAYMAPEQLRGGDLTGRTDVYQIGVTMYELLTGELPFDASSLMYDHVNTPAPSVRLLRPDVDPSLADLVAAALRKNAEDRPPTDVFLAKLQALHARLSSKHPNLTASFAQGNRTGQDAANADGAPSERAPGPPRRKTSSLRPPDSEESERRSGGLWLAVILAGVVAMVVVTLVLLSGGFGGAVTTEASEVAAIDAPPPVEPAVVPEPPATTDPEDEAVPQPTADPASIAAGVAVAYSIRRGFLQSENADALAPVKSARVQRTSPSSRPRTEPTESSAPSDPPAKASEPDAGRVVASTEPDLGSEEPTAPAPTTWGAAPGKTAAPVLVAQEEEEPKPVEEKKVVKKKRPAPPKKVEPKKKDEVPVPLGF